MWIMVHINGGGEPMLTVADSENNIPDRYVWHLVTNAYTFAYTFAEVLVMYNPSTFLG